MAIVIDVKPLLIAKLLEKKRIDIAKAIQRGVNFATSWLEGKVVEDQMSGRQGSDPGKYLNRVTGTLSRAWRHKITNAGLLITAKISVLPEAWYAKVHQRPPEGSPIPKRLYVVEYFKAEASKVYTREIAEEIGKL